ncbi:MAG: IS200/IS605 family transposase [Acidobacteria bacterium]|nr:MAG: IS200/IS605 family transposase [Acidobacteriota bacterium]
MGSTNTVLLYHLVFGTKDRYPFIKEPWADRLNGYLGGCIRDLHGESDAIGGSSEHMHLLLSLRPTHCLSDVVREIKRGSSAWLHDERISPKFGWQDGYGCATVSPSLREAVKKYIKNQREHHRKRTFKEEYLDFLKKSGIEYDERYLW